MRYTATILLLGTVLSGGSSVPSGLYPSLEGLNNIDGRKPEIYPSGPNDIGTNTSPYPPPNNPNSIGWSPGIYSTADDPSGGSNSEAIPYYPPLNTSNGHNFEPEMVNRATITDIEPDSRGPRALTKFNVGGCTDGNDTTGITINIHGQKEIARILADTYNRRLAGKKQVDPLGALKLFFGTIFEELNRKLYPHGIQLEMAMSDTAASEISSNGSQDSSCEIASPVMVKTEQILSDLKTLLNEEVGLQISLFGCMYLNRMFNLTHIVVDEKCRRVMGVMWSGMRRTQHLIKNLIFEAISGVANGISWKGNLKENAKESIGSICNFVSTCIHFDGTRNHIGVRMKGRKHIVYRNVLFDSSEMHRIDNILSGVMAG